ncbi:hypothetical protein [Methanoculleus chikugoensis]|nr:hypothetical protein [Methanoculleus chikugoensis]
MKMRTCRITNPRTNIHERPPGLHPAREAMTSPPRAYATKSDESIRRR